MQAVVSFLSLRSLFLIFKLWQEALIPRSVCRSVYRSSKNYKTLPTCLKQKEQQAEAEVVPSSSLVEIEVEIGAEV